MKKLILDKTELIIAQVAVTISLLLIICMLMANSAGAVGGGNEDASWQNIFPQGGSYSPAEDDDGVVGDGGGAFS